MDVQNKTRALIEAAVMVVLTSIFAIVGIYIPILVFVAVLIPVPLTVLGKRQGIKFSVLAMMISSVIVGSLTGPIYSVTVIGYGSMSIVMGYMMNRKYKPFKILLSTMLVAIVLIVVCINVASVVIGVNIIEAMIDASDEIVKMQISMYEQIETNPKQMEQIKLALGNFAQMMKMVIPFMMISAAALFSYINYLLTTYILKRLGHKVDGLPRIREVHLPKSIIMGTFLIMGLTLMTKNLGFINYTTLVLNIFLIFQFIYLIQGLAVVSYFMHSYKLRKPLRILIYIFLLLNQMTAFMLAIIGFIDAIINVRKLKSDH